METETIRVREARPGDHPRIAELTERAYDTSGGTLTRSYRESMRDVADRVASGATVLVAEDGAGVIVGSVTLTLEPGEYFEHRWKVDGDAGFRMLAVDPDAQGRRVGRALVEACISRSREYGRRRLVITTMEWMNPAKALYRSLGFVRRPDLDVTYPSGVGQGYTLDLVPDAAGHFPTPGPVPDTPPWHEDIDRTDPHDRPC